jgi:NitT/TauT family transport system substrate-binding protein
MSDIGAPGYGGVLIARRDHLDDQRDIFVRYTRALIKGWRWMVDHPDETAEIIVQKYAPIGTNVAEQTDEARLMRDYITHGDGTTKSLLWIDPAVFEQSVVLAREAGTVAPDAEIDVSRYVTQSVVLAASGGA